MKSPMDETIESYNKYFKNYEEKTSLEISTGLKRWMDLFLSYIPEDGKVLEIGSATGRDARYFTAKGYDVLCTDVIDQALSKLKEEGLKVTRFDFRDKPRPEWIGKFYGFFANAVLLHAPLDIFKNALKTASVVLKQGGVMAFCLKIGQGTEKILKKMNAHGYVRYYNEKEVKDALSDLPFFIISFYQIKTTNANWLHVIARKV